MDDTDEKKTETDMPRKKALDGLGGIFCLSPIGEWIALSFLIIPFLSSLPLWIAIPLGIIIGGVLAVIVFLINIGMYGSTLQEIGISNTITLVPLLILIPVFAHARHARDEAHQNAFEQRLHVRHTFNHRAISTPRPTPNS